MVKAVFHRGFERRMELAGFEPTTFRLAPSMHQYQIFLLFNLYTTMYNNILPTSQCYFATTTTQLCHQLSFLTIVTTFFLGEQKTPFLGGKFRERNFHFIQKFSSDEINLFSLSSSRSEMRVLQLILFKRS